MVSFNLKVFFLCEQSGIIHGLLGSITALLDIQGALAVLPHHIDAVVVRLCGKPIKPATHGVCLVELPDLGTGTRHGVVLLGFCAGGVHVALTEGEGQVAGVAPVIIESCRTPVCLSAAGVGAVAEGIT